MNRIRLTIAVVIIYVAARIAPRIMRTIFEAYAQMLERFPAELASGHTYGVVTVPWGSKAEAMIQQEYAINASKWAREHMDEIKKLRGEQKP